MPVECRAAIKSVRTLSRSTRGCSTLVRHFPALTAQALSRDGHATFDGALSAPTTAALRAEIDQLAFGNHLRPNTTHVSRAGSNRPAFPKAGVHEAEVNLLPDSALATTPTLCALRDDPTIRALLSVLWPRVSLHSHALKVQRADGKASCFPIHVDSSPDVDRRLVTALLYLNSDWDAQEHGGSLRLYENPAQPVDVAPSDGRLVLLASTGLHHRVLPSFRQRYVITVWCSGTLKSAKSGAGHEEESFGDNLSNNSLGFEQRLARILLKPKFRDMTFRLALVEEWERSLWEAHAHDVAREAVETHRANLELIRSRLPMPVCRELDDPSAEQKVEKLFRAPGAMLEMFRKIETHGTAGLSFQW